MPDVQQLLDQLARRTGASVLVASMSGDVLAQTAHDPADDALTAEAVLARRLPGPLRTALSRTGAGAASGTGAVVTDLGSAERGRRFGMPLVQDGTRCGLLVGTCPDDDLEATKAAARELARDLTLAVIVHRKEAGTARAEERRVVADLVSSDPDLRSASAETLLERRWFSAGPATVLVASVRTGLVNADEARICASLAAEFVRDTRPPREVLTLPRQSHAAIVVAGDPAVIRVHEVARDLHARLLHEGSGARVLAEHCGVGVGRTVGGLTEVHRSYREAVAARRVVDAEPHREVVAFDDAGVYRVLAPLRDGQLEDAVGPGVRRLLEHDEEHGTDQVETLETYLDHGCDVRATAATLHLHRASLYALLRRIEELTGVDLADGQGRLAVHVSLKAARLLGRLQHGTTADRAKPADAADPAATTAAPRA